MKAGGMRTFDYSKSVATFVRWLAWLCFALALGSLVLTLSREEWEYWAAITLFLGALGWAIRQQSRKLPLLSVSADDDGLWLAHLSKAAGLIPWGKIHSIREHLYGNRLDLLDREKNRLVSISYDLLDFHVLRDLIFRKAHSQRDRSFPIVVRKKMLYRVGYILGIAMFPAVGLIVGIQNDWDLDGVVGASVCLGLGACMAYYCAMNIQFRLVISETQLEFIYPLRGSRYVAREHVGSLELQNDEDADGPKAEVRVSIQGESKPLRLADFDISTLDLMRILQAWKEGT